MTSAHADFYLGTSPQARWLGSLAEFGTPSAGWPTTGSAVIWRWCFTAEHADTYEAAVVGLLAHRAAKGGFAVVPGPDVQPAWQWARGHQWRLVRLCVPRRPSARVLARQPVVRA